MHDYLRAIGFGRLTDRKSLQRLLSLVMTKPDREYYAGNGDRTDYWEKSKDFLPGAGLTVRGDTDEKGIREYEYFFPHYHGSHMSFTGNVDLEKAFEREEYNGVCELSDMGVVMVFHLNRLKDYAARIREYGYLEEAPICLSGLSVQGSVLIPLARTQPGDGEKKMQSAARRHREAAENGDPEALAAMAMQDLLLFNMITHRIMDGEDVLSVVETSFMPFSTASDQYLVLGDILDCKEQYNQLSGEKIWQLTVLCNSKMIDICINAEDLMGEPKPGRRFRGTIWLQGQLS